MKNERVVKKNKQILLFFHRSFLLANHGTGIYYFASWRKFYNICFPCRRLKVITIR